MYIYIHTYIHTFIHVFFSTGQSDVPPIPQQQFSSPDTTPIGSRGNSSSRELLNGKSPNVTNTHEKYAR